MLKSGRIAGWQNRKTGLPEMRLEEDGKADERCGRSSGLRQRVANGLRLPTTGSWPMQSALLSFADELKYYSVTAGKTNRVAGVGER